MKQSTRHLFLRFSPFPLEMLPQNMLTQLLQARSKSVWKKSLNPSRVPLQGSPDLILQILTALKEITLHQIHGSLSPSPYRLLVHSLCGTFRRRRQTAIPSVSPSSSLSFSLLPCALFCRHMKPSLNPLLRHLSSSQSLFFISFFFKGFVLET